MPKKLHILIKAHPKVTSGRMMGTELTLFNPFVNDFVRNARKLQNFRRIPDGSGSVNGCCVDDWLQYNAFCLHHFYPS